MLTSFVIIPYAFFFGCIFVKFFCYIFGNANSQQNFRHAVRVAYKYDRIMIIPHSDSTSTHYDVSCR